MPAAQDAVVHTFTTRLAVSIEYHRELLLAVHLKTHQAALETMLVEQFVLSAAVLWEVFLSDLLLAYLTENPKTYLANLKKKLLQSVRDRYGAGAARYADVDFPKQLSRNVADALVDPKSFNVTVKSADDLSQRANEVLAAEFAKKFTLASDDARFLDFGIAIRNYLSHRSKAARTALKVAIPPLQGPNADLAGMFQSVGAYLKLKNANGDTRSVVIATRFVDLAKGARLADRGRELS